MTGKRQRLVAGALGVVGVALAIFLGGIALEEFCRLRFAENVILREKVRRESYWRLDETDRGYLLRVMHGRFAGWYLAADDLMNSETRSPSFFGLGPRSEAEYTRNLILRERSGEDCYWKMSRTVGGHLSGDPRALQGLVPRFPSRLRFGFGQRSAHGASCRPTPRSRFSPRWRSRAMPWSFARACLRPTRPRGALPGTGSPQGPPGAEPRRTGSCARGRSRRGGRRARSFRPRFPSPR